VAADPAGPHGYGHFTAMQVRDGRTRGLARHLRRLDGATQDLFGVRLDGEMVRHAIRDALAGTRDASVRVYVVEAEPEPALTVTVRPPGEAPAQPQRLRSVPYLRPVAHIKHLGDFGQTYYGRLARREGFDDALLVGAEGEISEAAIANVGFIDGTGVVWPDAPQLHGITMQLLERALGTASRRAPVRLSDLTSFSGAFVSNARGIAPIAAVDDVALPGAPLETIREAYASVAWDTI
jgi:branched-subunit amino acid aminotransferase/4-amino-4-deoxychorismate lyase